MESIDMFIVIPISSLKPSDVGRWVVYSACPGHVEHGRIKSWTDRFIYVVYRCPDDQWGRFEDYTAAPTVRRISNLKKINRPAGSDDNGDLPQFELNKRLTAARTDETRARQHAQITREKKLRMEIAVARGELIPKKLVQDQAAYLFVALRQKILASPQGWSRQLTGITDRHEMQARLLTLAHQLLNDLRDMPAKVTDPRWIETLDEDDQ